MLLLCYPQLSGWTEEYRPMYLLCLLHCTDGIVWKLNNNISDQFRGHPSDENGIVEWRIYRVRFISSQYKLVEKLRRKHRSLELIECPDYHLTFYRQAGIEMLQLLASIMHRYNFSDFKGVPQIKLIHSISIRLHEIVSSLSQNCFPVFYRKPNTCL